MNRITTIRFMTLSISLARLIRKAIPSQMAGPIIRAMSFSINLFAQARKPTSLSTVESLPPFQYRTAPRQDLSQSRREASGIARCQLANERIVYEIKRLKNCADLIRDESAFTDSPFSAICADVVVSNAPPAIPPHTHKNMYAKPSEISGAAKQTQQPPSSPASP